MLYDAWGLTGNSGSLVTETSNWGHDPVPQVANAESLSPGGTIASETDPRSAQRRHVVRGGIACALNRLIVWSASFFEQAAS
jgi:hypothetical protein